MKIGLMTGTGDSESIEDAVDQIVRAEADGFASAWRAQIMGLDALTIFALAAQKTSRIELGTAVVPTYPRHPHSLAMQAATVNVASGGRLALGIGRSHQIVIEGMLGLSYDRPISHMRDYVSVLRGLLDEGNCSVDGKCYQVNGSISVQGASPLPILIGALMPKMLELCGELCDGTLTWMSGPKHLAKNVVPTLNAAAERAGRPKPRTVVALPVCVTDDAEQARRLASKLFVIYGTLPVYRACLDEEGVEGPADIALVGNEDEVRRGLAQVAEAGATDFYAAIFPAPGDTQASMARTYDFLKSLGGEL